MHQSGKIQAPSGSYTNLQVPNVETSLENDNFHSIWGFIVSMKFRNAEDEKAFYSFSVSRISLRTVTITSILMATFGVIFYVLSLLHAKSWTVLVISLILTVMIRYPLFIILWKIRQAQNLKSASKIVLLCLPWVPTLENILAISSSFSVGISLIARTLNGKCESFDPTYLWGCNPELASNALPQEHMVLLMLLPIIYSVVYKAIKWEYVCLTWFMVITCISISIAISTATQSVPCLLVYIPLSLIILYENHRQNLILFFVAQKQQQLLEENKTLSENAQNELRHMIANVAHDLKTPLAAFMNGVEVIAAQVTELQIGYDVWEKLSGNTVYLTSDDLRGDQNKFSGSKESNVFSEAMVSLNDNIKNLFNVNSFMTMTINRCIDYTKASKGLKLEARLETVDLQEIIALPLTCMRDLQTRIKIVLNPIAADIASHVITDKQWLQENLFCLMSNATKYSSSGNVSITVSLTDTNNPLFCAEKAKIFIEKEEKVQQGPQQSHNQEQTQPLQRVPSSDESQRGSNRTISNRSRNMYPHMDRFTIGKSKYILEQDESTKAIISRKDILESLELGGILHMPSVSAPTSPHASKAASPANPPVNINSLRTVSLFNSKSPKIHVLEQQLHQQHGHMPGAADNSRAVEEFLLIEVEDTGIGLSEEVMATLFTPFKQAQRRAGGTGLGLYSLAKRVQALGGYYGVCARRDGHQGSLFWFAIPYKADSVPGVSEKIPSTQNNSNYYMRELIPNQKLSDTSFTPNQALHANSGLTASNTAGVAASTATSIDPSPRVVSSEASTAAAGKLNILIVDDSVSILKMTSMMLKRQGHTITQAENGAEALERISEARAVTIENGEGNMLRPFDVVLMDLNMPVMDGLEATTRLRKIEAGLTSTHFTHHQFVIGFSANSDHATMMEAYEAGVDEFICKPFALQTFNDTVQRYQMNQGHVVAI